MRKHLNNINLYLILSVGTVLLFFGGPGYYGSRSFKRIWDVGHIILFFVFTYVLLNHWKRVQKLSFLKQIYLSVSLTVLIGIFIELLQARFNRTPDLGDLWNDILGALLCLFFLIRTKDEFKIVTLRIVQSLLVCLLIVQLFPPFKAVVDDIVSKNQFPVLANFETCFELDRWNKDKPMKRTKEIFHGGKACGKVYLTTKKYSGISLDPFVRNWGGYNFLEFYIYLKDADALKLTCRIHDYLHTKNGQLYEDRFNKQIFLKRGWNQILMPIEEIVNAPAGRKMNIQKIVNFCIFASNLTAPKEIYIDDVMLLK